MRCARFVVGAPPHRPSVRFVRRFAPRFAPAAGAVLDPVAHSAAPEAKRSRPRSAAAFAAAAAASAASAAAAAAAAAAAWLDAADDGGALDAGCRGVGARIRVEGPLVGRLVAVVVVCEEVSTRARPWSPEAVMPSQRTGERDEKKKRWSEPMHAKHTKLGTSASSGATSPGAEDAVGEPDAKPTGPLRDGVKPQRAALHEHLVIPHQEGTSLLTHRKVSTRSTAPRSSRLAGGTSRGVFAAAPSPSSSPPLLARTPPPVQLLTPPPPASSHRTRASWNCRARGSSRTRAGLKPQICRPASERARLMAT